MTAGLNNRFRIWRLTEESDDYVGGASLSGTVVYSNIMGRMQAQVVDQVFLAQGMETDRQFNAIVIPGTLDVRERDEVELTHPKDHWEFGKRFRVLAVSHSDHNPRDPRNYLRLQLTRSVRAHGQQ